MIGRNISHYRVLEELGRGGMGQVYRALDVRLEREVALKILPPELVADEGRKRRFLQEAKAAAAIRHSAIAVVHDVGEEDGLTFIAMELIEGRTLAELLEEGPLPVDRALEIANPILGALARAHASGIIHRDLKPANVMLDGAGEPKLIDFGLAKLVESPVEDPEGPTAARDLTQDGAILGTVSYMSPEQATGRPVDPRTDIFSFGVLLAEMLTGRHPFKGSTTAETLANILRAPAPDVGGALAPVVKRCLEKDAAQRYPSIEALAKDLTEGRGLRLGFALPWRPAVAVLAMILLGGIGAYFLSSRAGPPRLANAVKVSSAQGVERYPSLSPDGNFVAYWAGRRVWVAQVGGAPFERTAGFEGRQLFPVFSPDGLRIAFLNISEDETDRGIFTMDPLSGGSRRLTATGLLPLNRPQWSADGSRIAYELRENGRALVEILDITSGAAERIDLPGRRQEKFDLSWSSDGRFLAYVDGAAGEDNFVTQLWVLRLEDGEAFPVTESAWNDRAPNWSPDGDALFFTSSRGGTMELWWMPMGRAGRPRGDPEPVSSGLGLRHAFLGYDGDRVAYSQGRLVANVWRVPLLADRPATWADAEQVTFDEAYIGFLDVSPDRGRLLFNSDRSGNPEVWLLSLSTGGMERLTEHPDVDKAAQWSPDGGAFTFISMRSGNRDVWVQDLDGGPPRVVSADPREEWEPAWSPDGTEIVFTGRGQGLWSVPAEGGEAELLFEDPAPERPRFSPDGRWIAFEAKRRLWLLERATGKAEQLTFGPDEDVTPIWSPDGAALYFIRWHVESVANHWMLSLADRTERQLTDFQGRVGRPGYLGLTTDGDSLYFVWEQNFGDIWVADLVAE